MLRIHAFREDKVYRNNIENTLKPARVNPADYAAIYYAGGHCTMWDFPEDQAIAARIYENNGVIGAVCHGPAGLVNEMPFRAVSETLTAAYENTDGGLRTLAG